MSNYFYEIHNNNSTRKINHRKSRLSEAYEHSLTIEKINNNAEYVIIEHENIK